MDNRLNHSLGRHCPARALNTVLCRRRLPSLFVITRPSSHFLRHGVSRRVATPPLTVLDTAYYIISYTVQATSALCYDIPLVSTLALHDSGFTLRRHTTVSRSGPKSQGPVCASVVCSRSNAATICGVVDAVERVSPASRLRRGGA